MANTKYTLPKEERIKSRTLIDMLFAGGKSRSMVAFPLRVVYMVKERENLEPQTQMLVSVPKRCFKRAVKRNRVKRQLREAYRRNKQVLHMSPWPDGTKLVMAFIWLDDNMHDSALVEARMKNLLERMTEKLCSRTE